MSTNSLYMLGIVVVFFAVMYFLAIRPQSRQRKAHQEMMAALKKGDQVMTAGGIYGKVVRVEENVVVIEIAKGVTMKVVRRAISDIIRDSERAKAVAPEGAPTLGSGRAGRSTRVNSFDEGDSDTSDESDDDGGAS